MKPATMRYFDAIHALLEARSTWKSDIGDQINRYLLHSGYSERDDDPATSWEYALMDKDVQIGLLESSEPYFLDGDIQQWIMDSVASFPRDILIGDVLPPSRTGWLLFERPMMGWDSNHNRWAAIAWATIDVFGKWPIDVTDTEVPQSEGYPVIFLGYYYRTPDGKLIMINCHVWPFNADLHAWDMPLKDSLLHEDAGWKARAFVISLFAFMKQPFTTVESRHLPRGDRRSLQRKTGIEDPQINVISLRRAQYTNGQSKCGPREWSSRWLVKGHWRSQYYPSKQKNSPLWIMPYVKGPQDKPLKSRNDIALFHVTR